MAPRQTNSMRARSLGAVVCALVSFTAAAQAMPGAGSYDAQLCVATSEAAPSCGPVQVDLQSNGAARVRVSDFVYRLKLNSSQVEVALMHGPMLVDEFVAVYEWAGSSLQFVDVDKSARYELKLGERKGAK